jgi:hypothetical protein
MDTPLQQLPDYLKIILSVLSLFTGLLPSNLWGKFEPSKTGRLLFGASAALGILWILFRLWPVDDLYCEYLPIYLWVALGLLIWFFVALALNTYIVRQFSHSQRSLDEEDEKIVTVLGGPKLTPVAFELQEREPGWTTQQIFASLNYDIHKTWERNPRTLLILLERFFAHSKLLALLWAFVVLIVYFLLWNEIHRVHSALEIDPATEQTLLAGRSIDIRTKMQECRPDINWDIEGLSALKASGALGEVSSTGTYSAPLQIDHEVDLYVVATPLIHPYERRKLKIMLRKPPEYVESHRSEGEDKEKRKAEFEINVIDKRYSWVIGDYKLRGKDGLTFVQEMAARGMFNGFESIICVGAASREIKHDPEDEDLRALNRANLLGEWVYKTLQSHAPRIYALKIGRYNESVRLTPEETERERQVVIVGVLPGADEDVDLMAALRDAFERKRYEEPLLGMYLDKYPEEKWGLRRIEGKR